MRTSRVAAAVTVAVLLLTTTAAPAAAIVDGITDTTNRFPNVGGLQVQFGGDWANLCTGTLVAPDVVLTAAHCTDFFTGEVGDPDAFGPDDWRISFEADPDENSGYYGADHFVVHPDWLVTQPGPGGGNSKAAFLKEGAEDIALVFLTETVANVTPARVADAGYLDRLDLTAETFTVVGYGYKDLIRGSAVSAKAVVVPGGTRNYRDVTVITEHELFADRFIKITTGTCFGDSGGPTFHEGTLVALTSWGLSLRCDGPGLQYRTDSAPAQSFIAANL